MQFLLDKREYYLLDILAQSFGLLHRMGLTIDTDNGLGIALAQMHPTIGKIDLNSIDGGHLLTLIVFLNCLEDGIHIHLWLELKFSLCNAVLRISLLEFTDFLTVVTLTSPTAAAV